MNVIERLINDDYVEHMKYATERKDNEIFVSELVLCKQRAEFNKRYYYMYQPNNSALIGKLIHRGLELFLYAFNQVEYEKEFSKQLGDYIVRGRVDVITEDEVIEIKTGMDHRDTKPSEHHLQQVRLYMWLTGKQKGRIVYVTYGKLAEYEVTDACSDDEVAYMIDNWLSPRYEWECDYCQFKNLCPHRVERKR